MSNTAMEDTLVERGAVTLEELTALHETLKGLGSPVRLRLLWELREPRHLVDLRVPAHDDYGPLRKERHLSRSTVLGHIQVLEGLRIVDKLDDGRYALNRQTIVSLVHRFGGLARIKAEVPLDVSATMPVTPLAAAPAPDGPKLVMVSGPEAGGAFPLAGTGPWRVGRSADAELRIEYDPHLSSVQAVITRATDGMHWIEAMPGTTNPAVLDFHELPPGEREPLLPGAILGVGSSRLVFKVV